jgi:very-short-patch-repair endonuclease
LSVVRFTNRQVLEEFEDVCQSIGELLSKSPF